MKLHRLADEIQANAASALRRRVGRLIVAIEEVRYLTLGKSCACVGDVYNELVQGRIGGQTHRDVPSFGGEFHGIAQQVP